MILNLSVYLNPKFISDSGYQTCVQENGENVQIIEQLKNKIADGEKYKLFYQNIVTQLRSLGGFRWLKIENALTKVARSMCV